MMILPRSPTAARQRTLGGYRVLFATALGVAIVWATAGDANAARPGSRGSAPAGQNAAAPPSQQAPPASTADSVSIDAISARLKHLNETKDADVPDRAALVERYQQALADSKAADEQKARGAEFDKARIAAPYQLETRKREAAAVPVAPAQLPAGGSLADWEHALAPVAEQLAAAQKALDACAGEPQRRAARRVEIPKTIAADRLKLEELQQTDSAVSPAERAPLIQARQIARAARQRALESEIAALEKELQSYDTVSAELVKLDHEVAQRNASELQQRATAWQEAINVRRRDEADREASQAHWAAVTAEPAVRQLADENSALADGRQQLAVQMQHLADDAQQVQQRLDKLCDEFKDVQDKVSVAGLTDAVGQMLRRQRSELATIDADRLSIRRRHDEIARVQVQLFDLEEQLADVRDVDARARQIGDSLPESSQAKTDDLRSLLQTRQKYVDNLLKDYNSYFAALVNLDSKQQELLAESEKYRSYIDERVLWIRSTHPLSVGDVRKAGEAIGWIAAPRHWSAVLRNIDNQACANPVIVALAGLLLAGCLWVQRHLKCALASHEHAPPGKPWLAALAAVMHAIPWPGLVWLAGWLCLPSRDPDVDGFCTALGAALQRVAGILLPLLLVRNICAPAGLAEVHFGWPSESLTALRRQLRWLIALGLPLVATVAMLNSQSNEAWNDTLGRALFLGSQFLLAGFLFATLRPPTGSLHRLMVLRRESWTHRLAYPAFFLLVLMPLALSAMAATGYYYTAVRLACRLQSTVWLVLIVVLIQASVSRWLTAMYRRLAIQAATRSQPISPDEAPEIDLEKVDVQTRRLLHSAVALGLTIGLYVVWIDVLPALRLFDRVTLWTDGAATVSLVNLLQACLIAVMTIMAAANLPGLLEFAVLQRLPLDSGVRYALSAVTRYSIAVVGLALGSGAIGIGWPKVQWLAAAVTFGLGFGLQEIFANFVSGLIVLFERPIRVGDTVTVGDVTGVVSRIRMRATTILDADRKELIVPNKEFITAKLVNWTLSDSVTRLVVRLGIGYGCDTQQVQQLLLRAAADTLSVLKNPVPKAVFMGFSEKWIDFELRVFVGSVEQLLSTRHQLNMAIDRAFRAAGVQLAVTQAPPLAMATEPLAPACKNVNATNQKAA